MSKKRNFRCPDCWRCYSNSDAVWRHQVKMGGRCIDSAPAYVADRINHERAKMPLRQISTKIIFTEQCAFIAHCSGNSATLKGKVQ